MLKNKNFEEKISKYKKIYIYPRNNSLKKDNRISNNKINQNSKIKYNISNLLLDNNITKKNKSFLIYQNSTTTSNNIFKTKNKLNDFNFSSFRRNKSTIKDSILFMDKKANNNIFDNKYEEILKELRYIKQNNKSININININNDFQIKNKIKSKSVKNCSSLSSQKNFFENDKNILNNLEKDNNYLLNNFNKIKDIFINNINDIFNNDNNTKIRNTLNYKYNKDEDINIDKNDEKEYLSLDNNRKIKYLNKINTEGNIKKMKKSNIKHIKTKIDKIIDKISKINKNVKERSKSTPKNIILNNTHENNNKNQPHINTEEKSHKKYYIDFKENICSNYNKINNTFNNEFSNNYNKDKNEEDSFIIKERYLYKNNNKDKNLNNPFFKEETDNKILNWINKEKKINEIHKNKNCLLFENINCKNFNNYQISNKYFNNNEPFLKIRKPIKSLNFGDYFDLELNKFNLNNYNSNKNNTNILTSKHFFKPIY